MNYKIAIPSYKRHTTLNKKTMKVLERYKVDPRKVFIFVADANEEKLYNDTLDKKRYNKIVVGKKGIKEIRNFMANYFKEGERIVYLDDDISRLWECYLIKGGDPKNKKHNKLRELKSFDAFVKSAFKLSEKTGYHNWGVYPTDNPFFMKSKQRNQSHISYDLKFLIGFFTGVINSHKAEKRTISDKEDYERTIKYYLKDGGVIRFNNISCNTRCYKEPGGIQADRKKENSRVNANILIKNYPNLVSINDSRNSGFVEIRLRDKTKKKVTKKAPKTINATKAKKSKKK
jgi:ribosomal protein L31E